MKLSSRFLLDGLYLVAGAFLTVTAMAWSAGTAGWTAFGVSAGVVIIAAASAAKRVVHALEVRDLAGNR